MVFFLNESFLFGFREVHSLGGADEEFRALQQKWHTEWGDCRSGVVTPLIPRNKKNAKDAENQDKREALDIDMWNITEALVNSNIYDLAKFVFLQSWERLCNSNAPMISIFVVWPVLTRKGVTGIFSFFRRLVAGSVSWYCCTKWAWG